jgi:hypothetical protein
VDELLKVIALGGAEGHGELATTEYEQKDNLGAKHPTGYSIHNRDERGSLCGQLLEVDIPTCVATPPRPKSHAASLSRTMYY